MFRTILAVIFAISLAPTAYAQKQSFQDFYDKCLKTGKGTRGCSYTCNKQ
jgi:hypothetical protein